MVRTYLAIALFSITQMTGLAVGQLNEIEIRISKLQTFESDEKYHPVEVIAVANAIQSLDKKKTLEIFRSYLKRNQDQSISLENKTSNDGRIIMLAILLFEPPVDQLPFTGRLPRPSDGKSWAWLPMEVCSGIPFAVPSEATIIVGLPADPSQLLEWIEKHGKMRSTPFEPRKCPLTACDELCHSDRFALLYKAKQSKTFAVRLLRRQALAALGLAAESVDDSNWRKLKREYTDRVTWNKRNQSFTIE
ncbi:MAG: hypothetical protein ACI9G1_004312 [Pirellulaceae bacterium]|jgi:hypothetical protein